jgi:hypothetical protein
VSRSLPWPVLRSAPSSEPSEDSEVEDADCVGESTGDTDTELADDEGTESVVTVLLRTGFCGRAVVAMLTAEKVTCGLMMVTIEDETFEGAKGTTKSEERAIERGKCCEVVRC